MVKLFSKNSNLCDHNSPTSQTDGRTDGQTDRQTTCDRNTALCTKVHRAVKIKKTTAKYTSNTKPNRNVIDIPDTKLYITPNLHDTIHCIYC